jgi:hypothetical protein
MTTTDSTTTPARAPGTVPALVRRSVRIDMDKDAYGQPWAIRCDGCPMKPHTDALGQAAPICASGLMTNLQGAVPVHMCKHYAKESIRNDNGALTVECGRTPNSGGEGRGTPRTSPPPCSAGG